MSQPLKVLHVAADPFRQDALNLGEEIRQVQRALRSAGCTDVIVESEWAMRPQELQEALLRHDPSVVHFSGHGTPDACLVLQGETGAVEVSQEALTGLFQALGGSVRLVLLNACHSEPQAEALSHVVGCAIGMRSAVADDAAIAFSASFYQALAFGKSIQVAFDAAKNAIALQGIPEGDVPRLFSTPPRLAQRRLVDYVPRGRKPFAAWIATAGFKRHAGVFVLLYTTFYAIARIPAVPAEAYMLGPLTFALYIGLHLYLRNTGGSRK